MDKISKEQRSETMRKVRSKDTKPELFVRLNLWHKGLRYKKHETNLPGKPDLFLQKYQCAIFVHGCFWHRHVNCKHSTTPANNYDYWQKKFDSNIRRDQINREELNNRGIRVIIVWECAINKSIKEKDDAIIDRLYYEIVSGKKLYVEF